MLYKVIGMFYLLLAVKSVHSKYAITEEREMFFSMPKEVIH